MFSLFGKRGSSTILRQPIEGDRVRIKSSVKKPRRGWGEVSHGDVGTITTVEHTNVKIKFEKQEAWSGLMSEIELAPDEANCTARTSSNPDASSALLDGNLTTCWQSDGKKGEHWFEIAVPGASHILELEIFLAKGDAAASTYMPEFVEVCAGRKKHLRTVKRTKVTTYGWTTLLDEEQAGNVVKVHVHSCHNDGVDVRIFGVQLKVKRKGEVVCVPTQTERAMSSGDGISEVEKYKLLAALAAAAGDMEAAARFTALALVAAAAEEGGGGGGGGGGGSGGKPAARDSGAAASAASSGDGGGLGGLAALLQGLLSDSSDKKKAVACPKDLKELAQGSMVRVRPGIRPRYGWGAAKPEMVGHVHQIRDDGIYLIDFPELRSYWKADSADLERTYDGSGATVQVSSNEAVASTLLDGNMHWYWLSDGEKGEHWVQVTLPDYVVEVEAVELGVPRVDDNSYLPDRLEVHVGPSARELKHINNVAIKTYDYSACLGASVKGRVVRIYIKSCHDNGRNVAIANLRFLCRTDQGRRKFVPDHTPRHGAFSPERWASPGHGPDPLEASSAVASGRGSGGKMIHGRFRQVKHLGKGGFGETFVVEDTHNFDRRLVLKMLHNTSGRAKELFEQEAKAMKELSEDCEGLPNLVAYFVTTDEAQREQFCLCMDLVEGGDLKKYVEEHGTLEQDEVVDIIRQLTDVLQYVHSKGTVHRDIKAENIMRRPDGRLVIIDFGVASVLEHAEDMVFSLAAGTPGYMSPEVARGMVVPASDYYSVGALAIYLLTGEHPGRLMDRRSEKPYEKIIVTLEHSKRITPAFGTLLRHMLAEDRNGRVERSMEALKRL